MPIRILRAKRKDVEDHIPVLLSVCPLPNVPFASIAQFDQKDLVSQPSQAASTGEVGSLT